MATNHIEVVKRIDANFPHLLRHNTKSACGEFIQRVCAESEMKIEGWGLLSKPNPGQDDNPQGYTFPNGQKCSYDYVALPNGERVDIIAGGAGYPNPGGPSWAPAEPHEWRPSDVYVNISGWPIYPSDAPVDVENKVAMLGRGWFCLLRGIKDWPDEVDENWNWILKNENPDIFRIMLNVEGMMHQGHTGIDPWRDASVDPNASYWTDSFKEALSMMMEKNKKAWLTLHGGTYFLPTESDRLRFNDKVLEVINHDDFWPGVLGFEIANEYNVNGFSNHDVQVLGDDLRRKLQSIGKGNIFLALSTPALAHGASNSTTNEDMLKSMQDLYGVYPSNGFYYGANCMTIHRCRDFSVKWSSPFTYNTLMPELPKLDNEPSGQDASAGGDKSDPAFIVDEYKNVSNAGWMFYMAHNAWCVWNGHMPPEWLAQQSPGHSNKYIEDMTNQLAISEGLSNYRESGEVNIPEIPEGEEEMIAYDEEKSVEFGLECNKIYEESGEAEDAGMVSVHTSRCMWDYYVGKMEWDECLKKHVNEFRAEYKLPPV